MMRRHLLTLFALFTGLAALQTTAQASSLDSIVAGASAIASAVDGAQADNCSCEVTAQAEVDRCIVRQIEAPLQELPASLRPPVIVGPDRALE